MILIAIITLVAIYYYFSQKTEAPRAVSATYPNAMSNEDYANAPLEEAEDENTVRERRIEEHRLRTQSEE